ncbi:MAG: Biotin carboxylase-like protein [Candidatus Saccharibacteria bacterium]|nr:Biotin carboxylase-like protein [Candidatus Saccharibacteria bacterium]
MPNNPVLVVTNPLHYTYFRTRQSTAAIGSRHGLIQDYGAELGFDANTTLYDSPNTIEALIAKYQQANPDTPAEFMAWKAANVTAHVLGNDYALAHDLERKTYIRSLLPADLFPRFVIVPAAALEGQTYTGLAAQLESTSLVLQIDYSTGGKGTFYISDQTDLDAVLPRLIAAGQDIVASALIVGTSRGIQCYVTEQQAVCMDWWHRDLVGLPEICNLDNPHATKYCGAILEDIPAVYTEQARSIVQRVGASMANEGYRGVFGLDIVVDEASQKIYVIEVNPRFTAVSHLYATAMHAHGYSTDFMTAHIESLLEVGASSVADFAPSRPLGQTYYYLKLQNKQPGGVRLAEACRLGVYDAVGTYRRFGFGIDGLQASDEVVVIPESSRGAGRLSGERVFSMIGSGDPLEADHLLPSARATIQMFYDKMLVPDVGK